MSDNTETAVAEAPEQAAPAPATAPRSFDSVEDAVAELDRRDAARRAEKAAARAKAAEAEKPEPKAEAQQDEDSEDSDEAEEADEDDDDDEVRRQADDGEDSEDEREEAPAEEGDDEPPVRVVRLDGQDVEIPKGTPRALVEKVSKLADDLKADYTRKTQEVAQARSALAESAKANEEMVAQVQRAQQTVLRMAQQMIGEPPSLELAQSDIQAYTIQKALYEQRVQQLQALNQESGGLTQAQQQRAAKEREQALAEEARKMISVMPALAKPEARDKFLASAVEAAAKSGFSREDVQSVADHRMLHLLGRLIDAEARLAAQERAGSSVSAKLKNVPPKVAKAGAASNDNGHGDRARKAKSQFLRSGRTLADVKRYLSATER